MNFTSGPFATATLGFCCARFDATRHDARPPRIRPLNRPPTSLLTASARLAPAYPVIVAARMIRDRLGARVSRAERDFLGVFLCRHL